MYPSHTSPECLSAQKSTLKLLNNPFLPFLQLLLHIASLLQFFHFVLGDIETKCQRFLIRW